MRKFTLNTFSQKFHEIDTFNAELHITLFSWNVSQEKVRKYLVFPNCDTAEVEPTKTNSLTMCKFLVFSHCDALICSWYILLRKSKSLFGDLVPYNYVCGRLRGSSELKTFLGTDSDLICGNGLDCDELLVLVASTSAASQCEKTRNLLSPEKYFVKTTYSVIQQNVLILRNFVKKY